MKNYFLIALFILVMSFSCVSQKNAVSMGILNGITGIYEGNCMPSPGVEPCKPRPTSLEVIITSPSENYVQEKIVKTIMSDADGKFELSLPVGTYSLFIRDGEDVVCSEVQCETSCICKSIQIESKTTTSVILNLDHASW